MVQLSDLHGMNDGSDYSELLRNLRKFGILLPSETQIFPVNVKSVLNAQSVSRGAEGNGESKQLPVEMLKEKPFMLFFFLQEEEKNKGKLAQFVVSLLHPSFRISQLKVHHPCNKSARSTASSKLKNSLRMNLNGKLEGKKSKS